MEPKEVTITISGGNHSGKSSILSFLAMVLQCLESPATNKPIPFTIDPDAQTLKEGTLFTDEELTARLMDLIDNDKIRLVLKDVSTPVHGGIIMPDGRLQL